MRMIAHGKAVWWLACCALLLSAGLAQAATIIVALGASQTYGRGVARSEAYPAQLEALLRAKGRAVRVINAGINGNTTGAMLQRLGSVPNGTSPRSTPTATTWTSSPSISSICAARNR